MKIKQTQAYSKRHPKYKAKNYTKFEGTRLLIKKISSKLVGAIKELKNQRITTQSKKSHI